MVSMGKQIVIANASGSCNLRKRKLGEMAGVASCALALSFFCSDAVFAQAQAKPQAGSTQSSANEPARSDAPGGNKIACVNLRAVIANTAEGKQAAQQLESQFAERRKELEDLNKKINDLQQKLQAGATVIKDEERNKMTLEGQKLSRQLDRRQNEYQEDLGDAQNEIVQRIGRRVVEVIGKYAPSNGYSAVLDDSAQATPVMYASTDISQEIVRLYDQTYPAKAGAGPGGAKTGGTATKPSSEK